MASASDRWIGAVWGGAIISNLLEGSGGVCVREEAAGGDFAFCFLGLVLIQGLSDFCALRSFSRAVPYFSNLVGHRLASAGWFRSALLFPRQLTHLMSCGHWPSFVVSIESPDSKAIEHL